MRTSEGNQSQERAAEYVCSSTDPERTNQERYVMGIGRMIDEAVTERAGRDIGPTTAFHHLPQSDSESLEIRAGDEIAAMKPGANIREACSLLSSELSETKA
tara:strand:- start:172 stop:477 length:306 start_codon:yes stop_codon:yes gene_type:complete